MQEEKRKEKPTPEGQTAFRLGPLFRACVPDRGPTVPGCMRSPMLGKSIKCFASSVPGSCQVLISTISVISIGKKMQDIKEINRVLNEVILKKASSGAEVIAQK